MFESCEETKSDDDGMTPQFMKQKKPNTNMPRRNNQMNNTVQQNIRNLDKSSSNGSELLVGEQMDSKPNSMSKNWFHESDEY